MKYEVTERAEILLKEEVKIVRISVRDLVEFVLREGDIDNRKIGMSDKRCYGYGRKASQKKYNGRWDRIIMRKQR